MVNSNYPSMTYRPVQRELTALHTIFISYFTHGLVKNITIAISHTHLQKHPQSRNVSYFMAVSK